VGYGGTNCRKCAAGYYRVATACVPCPSNAPLYIGLFFAGVVLAGAVAGYLQRIEINLKVRMRVVLCVCAVI
jgi:hypothetical protein